MKYLGLLFQLVMEFYMGCTSLFQITLLSSSLLIDTNKFNINSNVNIRMT